MQRWIVAGAVFLVLTILLGVGAFFGLKTYRANKMTAIWLPLPVEQMPVEQRVKLADAFRENLAQEALMTTIARESGFTSDFGFSTDAEAGKELLRRFFCRQGHLDNPDGRKVPAIEIGFECKHKEFAKMEKATSRLTKELARLSESPAFRRSAEGESEEASDGSF